MSQISKQQISKQQKQRQEKKVYFDFGRGGKAFYFYSHDVGQKYNLDSDEAVEYNFPNEFIAVSKDAITNDGNGNRNKLITIYRVLPNTIENADQRACVRICYCEHSVLNQPIIKMGYGTDPKSAFKEDCSIEMELDVVYRVDKNGKSIEKVETNQFVVVNQTLFSELIIRISDAETGREILRQPAFTSIARAGKLLHNRCLYGYRKSGSDDPCFAFMYICRVEATSGGRTKTFYRDIAMKTRSIRATKIKVSVMKNDRKLGEKVFYDKELSVSEKSGDKAFNVVTEFNACFKEDYGFQIYHHVFGTIQEEMNKKDQRYTFKEKIRERANGTIPVHIRYINDFATPTIEF